MFTAWALAHKRLLDAELAIVAWELNNSSRAPEAFDRRVVILKRRADRLFRTAISKAANPHQYDLSVLDGFESMRCHLRPVTTN